MRTSPLSSFSVLGAALILAACPGDAPDSDGTAGDTAADSVSTASLGAQTYQQICITCHQADGRGTPAVYPPLAGSDWVTGDARIPIAIALFGMQGPITVNGETFNSVMQPWQMMGDAQIAAVVTYVRSSFGNNAPAVSEADVRAIRDEHAGRTLWTVPEIRAAFPPR